MLIKICVIIDKVICLYMIHFFGIFNDTSVLSNQSSGESIQFIVNILEIFYFSPYFWDKGQGLGLDES